MNKWMNSLYPDTDLMDSFDFTAPVGRYEDLYKATLEICVEPDFTWGNRGELISVSYIVEDDPYVTTLGWAFGGRN